MSKKDVQDGIIVEASLIRETKNSWLLDCEGDVEWFPKSNCNFDEEKEELEAPKWLLKQKFPNEDY